MSCYGLLCALVIYGALTTLAPAAPHHWACRDVPFWVKHYSPAQVESTMVSLGMAQWEINRLRRCITKENP